MDKRWIKVLGIGLGPPFHHIGFGLVALSRCAKRMAKCFLGRGYLFGSDRTNAFFNGVECPLSQTPLPISQR